MELKEWTVHHIRFKDVMRKRIKEIRQENNPITVNEKSMTKQYLVETHLADAIEKLPNDKEAIFHVVTSNTKENVNTLISNWETLIQWRNLTVIFVHTDENRYWHVNPKTHDFITDSDTVASSLHSLHESIPSR